MDLLYGKVISGCVIFLLTLIGGVVPFSLLRTVASRASKRTGERLNLLQSGACGVFIATCLLHLLPEARESLQDAVESDLPVCEMIVSFGFLLLLIVEQLLLACHSAGDGKDVIKASAGGQGGAGGGGGGGGLEKSHQSDRSDSIAVFRRKKKGVKRPWKRSKFKNQDVPTYLKYGTVDDSIDASLRQNGYMAAGHDTGDSDNNFSNSDQEAEPLLDSEEEDEVVIANTGPINRENSSNGEGGKDDQQKEVSGGVEKAGGGAGQSGDATDADSMAVLKSFVLMLALSLHTVFDGLVIGLQESDRDLWSLLAAVGLHKSLIAISISLSLLVSHRHHPRATLAYLFLFSLVAPLGVLIGTVLTETDFDEHAQNLASGVLQSVATGTFMYVTFVESLQGRFDGNDRLLNVLLVLVGFGFVCALRVLLPS